MKIRKICQLALIVLVFSIVINNNFMNSRINLPVYIYSIEHAPKNEQEVFTTNSVYPPLMGDGIPIHQMRALFINVFIGIGVASFGSIILKVAEKIADRMHLKKVEKNNSYKNSETKDMDLKNRCPN